MARKAILAGGTGLVGSHLLNALLANKAYDQVTMLARGPVDIQHPKLLTLIVDFESLADYAEQLVGDDIFCTLGTTLKQAGSLAAFRHVDYDYVHQLAQLTQGGGRQFLLVTAMGANARSKIPYNRIKGELEAAVSALDYSAVHLFRPAMLAGRKTKHRLAEKLTLAVMTIVNPLLVGPIRRLRSIHGAVVAQAMVAVALSGPTGINTYPSDEIQRINDSLI